MGRESFSASARISEAFLALRPPGSRIVAKTVCPLRARVTANSLPKPVLEPVMRTTCLEFMIIPPCDPTANQYDAGSTAVGYKSCIAWSTDCSVLPRSAQSQDTHGECSPSKRQHKRGGSNAFDIAYAQMGHGRAHKIEDEADAPRHSHGWPPDTENQAQCAGKLTCRQKRKVLQRHAYDFVDDMHYLRIATYLPDPGKRH